MLMFDELMYPVLYLQIQLVPYSEHDWSGL